MAAFRHGKVVEILSGSRDLVRLRVALPENEIEAVGYPFMLGPAKVGDRVVVNTTGLELGLGTGGVGFVLWNLDALGPHGPGPGHVVKLRYTPWQTEVVAAEAPESPHHETLREADTIEGAPVVACGLHSQVAGVAAGVKAARPSARVGYLMTDGGALPLAWSDLVRRLRAAGLIDVTATSGHAFGGDLESVNEFSGMLALRRAGRADVIVAGTGPGVVGTGTALGFSALEQGQLLDAAAGLGGRGHACLRISFVETRARHAGVSHHSLTALRLAARERCVVVVPRLPSERARSIHRQLEEAGVARRHELVEGDGGPGLRALEQAGVHPESMGRVVHETPELFLAAAAAGAVAGAAV